MGWLWGSKKQKSSSNKSDNDLDNTKENKMNENKNYSIDIMPTPNPNALKFLFSSPVKTEGSSTYLCKEDCKENKMASELFDLRGIDHIHLFDNFVQLQSSVTPLGRTGQK